MSFEGADSNKAKTVSVMRWAGVDIKQKCNTMTAILHSRSEREIKRIERYVHFTEGSTKAELDKKSSLIVADEINGPVIVIRLEDDDGFTPRTGKHGLFLLDQNHWKVMEHSNNKKSAYL